MEAWILVTVLSEGELSEVHTQLLYARGGKSPPQ
jgi:hypothetical protein